MLEVVSRFLTEIFRNLKVHGFQKENATNELKIFFLNKIEEDFFDKPLIFK